MPNDPIYSVILSAVGLLFLVLWAQFWENWKKRRAGEPVGQDRLDLAISWLKNNWAGVVIALGVTLIVAGLSGWMPASGGLSRADRNAVTIGALLVATGWLGNRRRS